MQQRKDTLLKASDITTSSASSSTIFRTDPSPLVVPKYDYKRNKPIFASLPKHKKTPSIWDGKPLILQSTRFPTSCSDDDRDRYRVNRQSNTGKDTKVLAEKRTQKRSTKHIDDIFQPVTVMTYSNLESVSPRWNIDFRPTLKEQSYIVSYEDTICSLWRHRRIAFSRLQVRNISKGTHAIFRLVYVLYETAAHRIGVTQPQTCTCLHLSN